ncbi:MAG: ribosome biogenesis GTPase Der [Phycisphaeraceae bacterium]|nr:ribosome biogenesis GTPase Der [Phycisphaeraceae bacterium]
MVPPRAASCGARADARRVPGASSAPAYNDPMHPKVAIVGRPNVGKSSLLNMLAGRRISIVDAEAGITRDRVSATVELAGSSRGHDARAVEFVDTGGHGIEDVADLTAQVERQIAAAVHEAQLILFVIDAQSGVAALDEQVARLLRTGGSGCPVLLVANKVDGPSHEPGAYEGSRLGWGDPLCVSATSGYHKHQLVAAIRDGIDWNAIDEDGTAPDADPGAGVLLAVVGKRNAGKSTLVNALAGSERVIVSEVEGTTRDAVDVRIELPDPDGAHRDQDGGDGGDASPVSAVTLIDTAGARKRKSIREDVEYYSWHRALRSIRRADVVLLLIDATVPVSQVDAALAREVQRHYKPCLVVVNKWDLAEDAHTQEQYVDYLDRAVRNFNFAPVAFISAARGEGTRELLAMAINLHRQAGHRVSTGRLNRTIERILVERTPVSKVGKRPKVYYVTQLQTHPPTIGLFVNRPHLFDDNYQRFLLNRLRDELPYSEVPIKLLIRGRNRIPEGAE